MTGVTRWNKTKTMAGSDGWNLTTDTGTALDSANVVVPVANATERDALTPPLGKYVGMAVTRADLGGIIEVWNGSAWLSVANRFNVPGVPAGQIPFIQSAEVSAVIGTGSAGAITFPTAFPSALRSLIITDATAGANGIVVKTRMDLSSVAVGKFTAFNATDGTGVSSGTTLYVHYIAIGY